jgi:hypothetical protein
VARIGERDDRAKVICELARALREVHVLPVRGFPVHVSPLKGLEVVEHLRGVSWQRSVVVVQRPHTIEGRVTAP